MGSTQEKQQARMTLQISCFRLIYLLKQPRNQMKILKWFFSSNPAEWPPFRTQSFAPLKWMRRSARLREKKIEFVSLLFVHKNLWNLWRIYLINKCDVGPRDAVQCIISVVNATDPVLGLIRIMHLLFGRWILFNVIDCCLLYTLWTVEI